MRCENKGTEEREKMKEILCSTGALLGTSNNRDYRLLEAMSKQLSCDGFEFMMYSAWYEEVEEMINVLQSAKLHIPVMHCQKGIGEKLSQGEDAQLREAYKLFEINCQVAQKLGAEKMVVHLWNGMISDMCFHNNLRAFAQLSEIVKQYGVELLVENVVCNVENPMKHWCELRNTYPDIHFVFDTKMAAFHEQMDLLYEKEYEWLWRDKHICHYHVNDYAGGYMDWKNLRTLPIGKGHIDFQRFFDFIHEIGYVGDFTVEATALNHDGVVDVDMLNAQFSYIREYMK